MTDRDDALRRELGWTGPEETNHEPDSAEPEPPAAPMPPVPSGPPAVEFVAPEPVANPADTPPRQHDQAPPGANRVPHRTRARAERTRRPSRDPAAVPGPGAARQEFPPAASPLRPPTRCARDDPLTAPDPCPPRTAPTTPHGVSSLAGRHRGNCCRPHRRVKRSVRRADLRGNPGPAAASGRRAASRRFSRRGPTPTGSGPTTWSPRAPAHLVVAGACILYKATFGLVNLGQSPDGDPPGRARGEDQVGALAATTRSA